MPPYAKITREMIVEAAFELTRNEGAESVNARSIAKKLGCSTQPVMYHFKTVEEIKDEVYRKADEFHSQYISDIQGRYDDPMTEIGMLYIKFAVEERHLFRYLFQSDRLDRNGLDWIIKSEEFAPVLEMISQAAGVDFSAARDIFATIFLTAHGFASMLANNSMEYDEEYVIKILEIVFMGAIGTMKEGSLKKDFQT